MICLPLSFRVNHSSYRVFITERNGWLDPFVSDSTSQQAIERLLFVAGPPAFPGSCQGSC